ncbi:MAG: hypothetical protein EAX95_07250 [Candidatus Thorarchaeota archaeon]|nr:hypothetical protein [Candidatus Thorarchaeota archaeon]
MPVTAQEIKTMIQSNLLAPEQTFLALGGPRPIATARWGWSDDGWAYITDLSCVPGLWSPVEMLVEHVLVTARDGGFGELRTWVPSCYLKLAEILTEFTFEPRRVRLQMQLSLPADFETNGQNSQKALRWKPELRNSSYEPGHRLFRPLELYEARDHSELNWEPRCYIRGSSGIPLLIGFRAKNERTKGWISLNEDMSKRTMPFISCKMVSGILDSLYLDGVREVGCEVDATRELQPAFADNGFESLLTLYEMELTMVYNT